MLLSDVELLRRLVAIDSTSALSNLPIADELAAYLEPHAGHIQFLKAPQEEKANLFVRFGPEPTGDGEGLILSGHMDAVPAKETTWESDPFTLTERDDRYVGRGTADMKGFLAVASNAAAAAANLKAPLILLFTYDEEVGTLGAKQFAESWDGGPLPKRCVIGEPTSFRPVRAHKGHLKLRITLTGKSAHSGYPHLGDNAIEKARPVLDGLVALRRELEGEPTEHRALFADAPYVPLNIATIRGGTAVNIVPDRCEIEVGIRLLPGMTAEAMIERVRKAIGDVPCEILSNSPPMLLPETSDIYQAALPFANRHGVESVSFASDAGWLQSMGIECLLFGPGAIEVAHQPNEFTPKDEFHRAGGVLGELIARFCA
ncbi:MAG TPA: acetylornithine deacetylase [Thermoanaerobaculia bacterium]|nr:acetylornithine deacetylase [Thermoanaerobaculia bacterium]